MYAVDSNRLGTYSNGTDVGNADELSLPIRTNCFVSAKYDISQASELNWIKSLLSFYTRNMLLSQKQRNTLFNDYTKYNRASAAQHLKGWRVITARNDQYVQHETSEKRNVFGLTRVAVTISVSHGLAMDGSL